MPSVSYLDHELVRDDETQVQADIKRFHINDPDGCDRDLLAAVIADRQYRDHYAWPDPLEQGMHDMHGPYWLRAITADMFGSISSGDAQRTVQAWLDSVRAIGPETVQSVTAGQAPSAVEAWLDGLHRETQQTQELLRDRAFPHLSGELYQLPDLRGEAEHQWGWIVGATGFHEFMAIDRQAATITLIVITTD